MTDLECLEKMFAKAEIEYERTDDKNGKGLYIERGYSGFFVWMGFDEHDNLKDMGAGE